MNILEFFRKVTSLEPTEDQKLFLTALADANVKNIVASAGRQTGKSLCSAVAVMWWVFEYDQPVEVLLMSTMDSYVYDHIEKLFQKNKELAEQVKVEGVSGLVPLRGFEVASGSRVHVRKGTERQIRGLGVDICIADEAAELPNSMITTALGNIRGSVAKFVMLSTPHKTGLFTEIVSSPDKYNFKIFNWSELNCSWHGEAELELKKKTMSTQTWKMEVLGQVLEASERAYFPTKHLDRCIQEVDCTRQGGEHSSVEVGIDFGYHPCATVVVVTEKLGTKRKVLFIKEWRDKPIEHYAPAIGDIVGNYQPALIKADMRPPEYKGKLEPYLKGQKIFYIDGRFHKKLMDSQLQSRVRQTQLIIPEVFTNLILQMRKYKVGLEGLDIESALAIACYEPAVPFNVEPLGRVYITPRKKVTTNND